MSMDLPSIVIGTVIGWSLGMLTAMAIGKWLHHRDRKRHRRAALDNAANELQRGEI